jgi:putative transposase
MTEIPTAAGKLYLATVLDLYSRRLLGAATGLHPDAELACEAIKMAVAARGGAEHIGGVIFHTDSVQYVAIRYTQRLAEAGAVASVGSRGDSYDCPGRGVQLAVQGRAGPQQGAVEEHRRPRDRHCRVHRLV